jgi:multicomponent K+:H+ antiporter subunit E
MSDAHGAARRWLPHPLASVSLWAVWLLANNTLAPAHLLLGAFLGIAIPLLLHRVWPEALRFRRPLVFARLLAVVIYDILVANVTVARLILGPRSRLHPGFFRVPLAVRNPYAVSALASVITLTPGTVSVDLSSDRTSLVVHALDARDEAAIVAEIKARYETPIKEILEC